MCLIATVDMSANTNTIYDHRRGGDGDGGLSGGAGRGGQGGVCVGGWAGQKLDSKAPQKAPQTAAKAQKLDPISQGSIGRCAY
jgi:hypothetical protein